MTNLKLVAHFLFQRTIFIQITSNMQQIVVRQLLVVIQSASKIMWFGHMRIFQDRKTSSFAQLLVYLPLGIHNVKRKAYTLFIETLTLIDSCSQNLSFLNHTINQRLYSYLKPQMYPKDASYNLLFCALGAEQDGEMITEYIIQPWWRKGEYFS